MSVASSPESTVDSHGPAIAVQPGHPWMPASPCGAGCLPRRGAVQRAGLHRVAARLGRVVLALLGAILLGLAMPALSVQTRQRLIRAWFRRLLAAFGIQYLVYGQENLAERGLFVSNHVSWLDIVVLQAICPMRLLAKTEVRSWPLIGPLASRAGTLYIERDRLTALPGAVRTVAEALREGAAVGAFPEGTTWCGRVSGRYRPAVFQAAVDADARVQPVAVRYRTSDARLTTVAAFVGDETLLSSALAVLRTRSLVIEVRIQPELDAGQIGDRRELASLAEAATGAVTEPPAPSPRRRPRSRSRDRRPRWRAWVSRPTPRRAAA